VVEVSGNILKEVTLLVWFAAEVLVVVVKLKSVMGAEYVGSVAMEKIATLSVELL